MPLPVRAVSDVARRVPGALSAAPRTARWLVRTRVDDRWVESGRPHPVASPALTANVVVDELMLAVMTSVSSPPTTAAIEAAASDLAAARALYAERGWLDDPASYHRDPPALHLSSVHGRSTRWMGDRFEQLRFPSEFEPRPFEPGAERFSAMVANRRAYLALLRHRDVNRPWVICLHGFGTGRPSADFLAFRVARLYRELGWNVAVPVLPLHGPRRSRGLPQMLSMDLVGSIHGIAQAVWDVRRVVRWIRTVSDAPIAVYGISLGAYTASVVAGLEDLDGLIAGIPAVDLPALFAHHSPPDMRRRAEAAGLLGPVAADAFRVVSPLALAPRVPVEHRALYAGIGDRFVPNAQAVDLWEHWERPTMRWYPGGHVGFVWSKKVPDFVAATLTAAFGSA